MTRQTNLELAIRSMERWKERAQKCRERVDVLEKRLDELEHELLGAYEGGKSLRAQNRKQRIEIERLEELVARLRGGSN